jgi:CRP-like cAMP-binding protein
VQSIPGVSKHILLKELQSKYGFPDEEFPKLFDLFKEKHYKKNEILFKAGDVVKHTYFILQGCVRQYYVSPEGAERIIYFAEEGSFCGELMSFLHETTTNLNMQALEETDALIIDLKNWETAITTIPAFALYYVKNHQRLTVKLKEELGKAHNETPDEKYRRLIDEKPHLLQRLPQYHLAAYIGVTPETLSRIRKRNTLI